MSSTAHTESAALPTVGRWEWRAFGDDIARGGAPLDRADAPSAIHESDELYVLSSASDASVKLRDGVIDVKELQRVRADGLQQWLPVLKAPLPLDADAANRVLTALGVRRDPRSRESIRSTSWSPRARDCARCSCTSGAAATRSADAWRS